MKSPHMYCEKIKYEHIHVWGHTNVYYSLVKPQEDEVLVFQLL